MAEKQWWEDGYGAAQGFLNQPRPDFANKSDKDGTGEGKSNFGLWQPDGFFVPVAKPPDTKKVKQVIFVADNPFYTRQHLGKVHNPRFPSGENWELFTCGATGDYYDPKVYKELDNYLGKNKIPGNFAPCCGEYFRATSKKGNPMPGHPMDVVYYTAIDCEAYTDKRGNTHQYVLKFFPAKGDTIDKLGTLREAHGSLEGAMYNAIRFKNKQSANTGEMMTFVAKGDMSALFPNVMYSGRLVSDLYEEARTNPKFRDALSEIFELPTAPDGDQILNKIPVFNYRKLLRPKSLEQLQDLFGRKASTPPAATAAVARPAGGIPGFSVPGFAPVASSEGGDGGEGKDDDIPF